MTKLWDDLFTSYRRYKWMDVDSPQYEPLENEVVSKEDLKKLKAKEYNEKNKDKQKIKRLEKLVAELRAENKTLKENHNPYVLVPDDFEALVKSEKELKAELEQREKDFDEFKAAVKVIMKYL